LNQKSGPPPGRWKKIPQGQVHQVGSTKGQSGQSDPHQKARRPGGAPQPLWVRLLPGMREVRCQPHRAGAMGGAGPDRRRAKCFLARFKGENGGGGRRFFFQGGLPIYSPTSSTGRGERTSNTQGGRGCAKRGGARKGEGAPAKGRVQITRPPKAGHIPRGGGRGILRALGKKKGPRRVENSRGPGT